MSAVGAVGGTLQTGPSARLSAFLHRHPNLRLGALLSAPLFWLFVAYLGSLFALFVAAFWSQDSFTSQLIKEFTLENVQRAFTSDVYRTVTYRTIGVALTVTVICASLAIPVAFYMAKVAGPRTRRFLVVAFLVPLWASYLVKAYAWRGMLAEEGVINWALGPIGINSPGFGLTATVIVLSYLWFPYMVLPIFAAMDRLPDSLVEASGDLGARAGRTFRSVILPITFPGIVAGSIFTFSLSMGDYIAVQLVGGKSLMLGNAIYNNIAGAGNYPLGAALALVSVVVILIYLTLVGRTGALKEL